MRFLDNECCVHYEVARAIVRGAGQIVSRAAATLCNTELIEAHNVKSLSCITLQPSSAWEVVIWKRVSSCVTTRTCLHAMELYSLRK